MDISITEPIAMDINNLSSETASLIQKLTGALDAVMAKRIELKDKIDLFQKEYDELGKLLQPKSPPKPTNTAPRKKSFVKRPSMKGLSLKCLEQESLHMKDVMAEYQQQTGVEPLYDSVYQFLTKNGWKFSGKDGILIKMTS
jgi:hypothetical protein